MGQYIELYKKYRPRTFADVVGQDTIVKSLQMAIIENRVPTGYLFSGTAGTGKTSIARILAKSINCENPQPNGEPCNECSTCKAIDSDAQPGIKYISMANNGGAEEVRQIMEESRVSQPVKRKVFILDEVQNMSSAAQDAMLIGLESDNQSTLFICCTTDPEKVKPAINSRLQIRTFRQLTTKELTSNLVNICNKESNIKAKIKAGEITKEQIIQCAALAGGSVRNSISNLETLVTSGSLPTEYSINILQAILTGNPLNVYIAIDSAANSGANLNRTAEDVYRKFTAIFKIKAGANSSNELLNDMAKHLPGNLIIKYLNDLSDTFKVVSNKVIDYKILYEMCFTQMALELKRYNEKSNK
jgi:DNA polymerase III, gamma/tau subunit dnaX